MAKKSQAEKFRETAHALEADESEKRFDAALKKIAAAKPAKPVKQAAKAK